MLSGTTASTGVHDWNIYAFKDGSGTCDGLAWQLRLSRERFFAVVILVHSRRPSSTSSLGILLSYCGASGISRIRFT